MKIRRAGPGDVPAIATGMKAVVDEGQWLATQPSTSEAELRERIATGLGGAQVLVLGEDEGALIGCAGVHPTRIEAVWSLGTWVAADHRGRGVGRRLVDAAVDAAAGSGARKIELEAFSDNVAALALYRAAGFEVEGVRRDHYQREDGTVKSAVIMALFPVGSEAR